MAKIHTHYDNLKVSRQAPQEVIRAAYKALSQKYHPDKNPGDEKAARIMAILNSAYDTLSDPVRRKEHDDWIASEEWEVEWLKSTEGEHKHDPNWNPQPVDGSQGERPRRKRYRFARDPKWWAVMGACTLAGVTVGVLATGQARLLPQAWATAAVKPAEVRPAPVVARASLAEGTLSDNWARHNAETVPNPPEVHSFAVTQLVVPSRQPDCDQELHTLSAPNGEPWPEQTGYVNGYPQANPGEDMQLAIDNTSNNSPVFVKVFDLEHRANVRHLYVLAHESMQVDKLAAGKYEVRYQNVQVGGTKAECLARQKQQQLRQAAAGNAAVN